jgi:hypothetical protein
VTQSVLLGVGTLCLAFFLWRLFQGVVSRTVAIPAGLAAGIYLGVVGLHPGLAALGGLVVYTLVTKLVRFSLRWAATLVVVGAVALVGWGLHTGRLALG